MFVHYNNYQFFKNYSKCLAEHVENVVFYFDLH